MAFIGKKFVLCLIVVLVCLGVFKGLVFWGNTQVYPYLVPVKAGLNVSDSEKRTSEKYFSSLPFIFKTCFENYINDTKNDAEKKFECIVFLPSKNFPWGFEEELDLLKSNDSNSRKSATAALRLYPHSEKMFLIFVDAWKKEKDVQVQLEMGHFLSEYGKSSEGILRDGVADTDPYKRIISKVVLYQLANRASDLKSLEAEFKTSDVMNKRFVVVASLAFLGKKSAPVLKLGKKDSDAKTREFATKHLTEVLSNSEDKK